MSKQHAFIVHHANNLLHMYSSWSHCPHEQSTQFLQAIWMMSSSYLSKHITTYRWHLVAMSFLDCIAWLLPGFNTMEAVGADVDAWFYSRIYSASTLLIFNCRVLWVAFSALASVFSFFFSPSLARLAARSCFDRFHLLLIFPFCSCFLCLFFVALSIPFLRNSSFFLFHKVKESSLESCLWWCSYLLHGVASTWLTKYFERALSPLFEDKLLFKGVLGKGSGSVGAISGGSRGISLKPTQSRGWPTKTFHQRIWLGSMLPSETSFWSV